MIISGCYVVAIWIGFSLSAPMMTISSQNPAISLGMIVAVVFKPGRGIQNSGMSWAWIYLVFPWVGSIVAVIIYEFLFKKGQDAVEAREEQIEDAENAEARLLQQE
jgi:glycerol uptake facilitator-like aquaporin